MKNKSETGVGATDPEEYTEIMSGNGNPPKITRPEEQTADPTEEDLVPD